LKVDTNETFFLELKWVDCKLLDCRLTALTMTNTKKGAGREAKFSNASLPPMVYVVQSSCPFSFLLNETDKHIDQREASFAPAFLQQSLVGHSKHWPADSRWLHLQLHVRTTLAASTKVASHVNCN
jgi:hypothetical protein